MSKIIDLTGKRFGRLKVIERAKSQCGRACWKCQCDCGNIKIIIGKSLRNGNTKSCGCLMKEANREKMTTHGMRGNPLYAVWRAMRQRCNNTNDKAYKNYGGRGIMVCHRWQKFENFFEDMGVCPTGFTLERIDNDKGYQKNNCKWATRLEQARNKRIYQNNKTGVVGVFWHQRLSKYCAQIRSEGKVYHLGLFEEVKDATFARRTAENKYWGKARHAFED